MTWQSDIDEELKKRLGNKYVAPTVAKSAGLNKEEIDKEIKQRMDEIKSKPSQVAREEQQDKTQEQKPSFIQKVKTGITKIGEALSGKKKIEQQIQQNQQQTQQNQNLLQKVSTAPINQQKLKQNILDDQINRMKSFDSITSAELTPEAKKKAEEKIQPVISEVNRLEEKSKTTETKDWRDRVYESITEGKDVPFAGDLVEIPETVNLLQASNRLREGNATQEDATLLRDWLDQQNRDSTFGYKVMDTLLQSVKFGAELYTTAGVYTFGKESAKKGIKYLMGKAGKEATEELLEKFGYKVAAGVVGETVRTVVQAPIKITQSTLEKQIASNLEVVSGITDSKESVGQSLIKSFSEAWVENVSERAGDAIGLGVKTLSEPLKQKLVKTAIFNTLSKAIPNNPTAITKYLAKSGYDGILNEMLEERIGDSMNGLLYEVGMSDQEFKLPTKDQLLVELVSFSVPGVINKTSEVITTRLDKIDANTIQMTPDAARDTVNLSNLSGTPAGDEILKAADVAEKDDKFVLIDLKGNTGNKSETTQKNIVGVSVSEEKIETEAKEDGEVIKQVDVQPAPPEQGGNVAEEKKKNELFEVFDGYRGQTYRRIGSLNRTDGSDLKVGDGFSVETTKGTTQDKHEGIIDKVEFTENMEGGKSILIDYTDPFGNIKFVNIVVNDKYDLSYKPDIFKITPYSNTKTDAKTGTGTSPEALEMKKQELLNKVSVGKQGETQKTEETTKTLTTEEIGQLKELAKASKTAKSFLDKIGKVNAEKIKTSGDSIIGFYNESVKEIAEEQKQEKETTIKSRVDELVQREKKLTENMQGSQKESALKGIGMEYSAIKRQIEGEPTYTEISNAKKYLESRHTGKKVTVDGKEAILTGKMSFGKSQVRFNDGSTKFVSGENITSDKITDKEVRDYIKNEAIKKLEGKERLFSIDKKDTKKELNKPEGPKEQPLPKQEAKPISEGEAPTEKFKKEVPPIKDQSEDEKQAEEYLNKRNIKFRTSDENLISYLINDAKKYSNVEDFIKVNLRRQVGDKDSHTAPSFDDTPVNIKIDDGGDFSLFEVANGYSNQPDDYFDPIVGARYYGYDTKTGRESSAAISSVFRAIKLKKQNIFITAYRAIPKGINVFSLKNGDWITFSKQYAIDHGESRFGEDEYKIIEEKISPEYAWWDGNDINEWGYDTGKDLTESELRDIYKESKIDEKFRLSNDFEKNTGIKGKTKQEIKELIVQHNLSEENLLFANKIGGLPVPSIAISAKETPLESFGEITLLGNKELITPSPTSKVYGSDIYSPRYPRITYTPNSNYKGYLKPIFDRSSKKIDDLMPVESYIDYFKDNGRRGIEESSVTKQLFYVENNKNVPTDRYELKNNAYKYADDNNYEYQNFVNEIVKNISGTEEIFMGFSPSGNRRYKPHTLENVVNIMKKELVDTEGFNYGVGNIRANLAKRFKSIKEIQANRDVIVSKDEMDEFKSYIEDKFEKIGEKAGEVYTGSSNYYMDTFTQVIRDGIKEGNLKEQLNEYGFENVDYEELSNFLTELKQAPTEYFEAKLKRAVDIGEFEAAIVPDNVSKEIINLLESKGVDVYKYSNEEDRADVVKFVSEKRKIAFRLAEDFEKNTGIKLSDSQEQKIIDLNKQIFGDEDIRITAQILTPDGQKALGSYKERMIEILDGQVSAVDTYYHEAVHKYFDIFTTKDEQIKLLVEAKNTFNTKDFAEAEEMLAENFINYVKTKETKLENSKGIFERIISRIKRYFDNEITITKFYEDIIQGKAKTKKTTSEKVNTAKNITQVKSALKSVKNKIDNILTDVEGRATTAQELRSGLNTKDIAALKLAWNRNQKFQEGDLETMRNSNYFELVNRVVEDVQIKYPEMSDDQAYEFALNLPTKLEEKGIKPEELKQLIKRQKTLSGYLETLKNKQEQITGEEEIKRGSELYQEWTNVLESQENLNKLITAQQRIEAAQRPVEEGAGGPKLSKVAQRVLDKLVDVKDSDVTYNPMNIVEDAAKAAEFVDQNPEMGLKIAKGLELPPPDITETAISIAMAEKERQDGNYLLYSRLIVSRSLRQTRRGQEIVAERGRQDENSSEFFIKKLLEERARLVTKDKKWVFEKGRIKESKIQDVIAKEVKKVKTDIDKKVLKKLESAQKLIDSLTCKI